MFGNRYTAPSLNAAPSSRIGVLLKSKFGTTSQSKSELSSLDSWLSNIPSLSESESKKSNTPSLSESMGINPSPISV